MARKAHVEKVIPTLHGKLRVELLAVELFDTFSGRRYLLSRGVTQDLHGMAHGDGCVKPLQVQAKLGEAADVA